VAKVSLLSFRNNAIFSTPPPNTRSTYDTVWFSFEGGKDTEEGMIFHVMHHNNKYYNTTIEKKNLYITEKEILQYGY
jgi:hypothetical protein